MDLMHLSNRKEFAYCIPDTHPADIGSKSNYFIQERKMKTKTFSRAAIIILILSLVLPTGVLAAPSNDNFADAQVVSLPYSVYHDTIGATFEADEPYPSCGYGYPLKTAWFAFTPSTTQTLMARTNYYNFPTILAIYTGSSLNSLSQINCGNWSPVLAFQAQAGVTYYFQIAGLYGDEGTIPFSLEVAPPPQVGIGYYPGDPSVYDNVNFYANTYDPAGIYGFTYAWTISDGTTSDQYSFNHLFTSDGDYTVSLTVTTADGRVGSATQVLQVRTRDIAISKFSVPQMASTNQTKTINVDIKNNRYSDYVTVYLYKGQPGGSEQQIGVLTIYVPARATKPTTFKFSYTFTASDAAVGKAVFKAIASINSGRDALPTDNTAIATSIVNR